ncbi:MAG TPA: hypothetical protein VF707_04675, partial [Ardenticatenaceae bacterium]
MLRFWKLAQFKSVCKSTELELAPLTVFAGANSSGKSTIIQSMLLTAQTLQSPVLRRPVILNGYMARLGAFSDIVSNANEEGTISIGFTLQLTYDEERQLRTNYSSRSYRHNPFGFTNIGTAVIDCIYDFSMRDELQERELLRLQPRLEKSYLKFHATAEEEEIEQEILMVRSSKSPEQRVNELDLADNRLSAQEVNSLQFEVARLHPTRWRRVRENLASSRNVGGTFRHFLPSRVTVAFDALETEVRQVVDALITPAARDIRELELNEYYAINDNVRAIIRDALSQLMDQLREADRPTYSRLGDKYKQLPHDFSLTQWYDLYRYLSLSKRGILAQAINERRDELRRAVRSDRESRIELRSVPLPELLSSSVDAIQQYFSSSVRYLGPLRDEPKPVYPLAGAIDPSDVGFRGEHTAAVLDAHRNTVIEYVPSISFSVNGSTESHKIEQKLLAAVLDWLGYMGVGTNLRTVDRGVLGHELKIATADGATLHDLTQVGVGVSQVLPILVLSLLAEPGSTLIFEQPELHLHPRVQTRLA